MKLTEQAVLKAAETNHSLEIIIPWTTPSKRAQIWFDTQEDLYKVKFDGETATRFFYFPAAFDWLGELAHFDSWIGGE